MTESDKRPKNLILVWGTATDFERQMKSPRDTRTEQTMKAAASARVKFGHPHDFLISLRKATWPTWRSSMY